MGEVLNIRQSIPYSKLPAQSRMWLAVTSRDPSVSHFYATPPASISACKEITAERLKQPRDWNTLARLLLESGQRYGVPASTLKRLDLLAQGKAVAVVTGQQVGYLGGPLYTFLKAYQTTRLAVQLEAELGLPVLPIFWLEGEDHDLEEVRDAAFLNATGDIVGLRYVPETVIPNFEVGRYAVDARSQLEDFAKTFGQHSEAGLGLLREVYAATTLSDGMGRFLARLLGSHGLLMIEGMDKGLKQMAAPLWREVLLRGRNTGQMLEARSADLKRDGWNTPLNPTKDSFLFYLTDETHCRAAVSYDGLIRTANGDHHQLSPVEFVDLIEQHPERISPKAALRPIYQDYVLPSIAYVGGPGELDYHAQIAPFYAAFNVPAPSFFPRMTATILDSKTVRNLEKAGLSYEDILCTDAEQLTKTVLKQADEWQTADLFAAGRQQIEGAYHQLKSVISQIDPTLAAAVDGSIGRSLLPLEHLQQKTDKALKLTHSTALARLSHIQTALRPGGKPVERVLSAAHYLIKYGPYELLRALQDVPVDGAEHQIISL